MNVSQGDTMSRHQNYVNDSEQWAAYQRRRDEQLGVVNRESLEQLQTAVDQAAAAGDPMAGQWRAETGDALLRNLTRHFTNRAAELKS
jgi:acyl-CoA reductase-like NAD-dependent aldehyde dehydrogenase